jgi:Rrf2 family iron-sulfur cluster assembly transcriptional regulator
VPTKNSLAANGKSRLAVTAMIDLALRHALGPVPLTDIALRQHASLSYLEQLFSRLRQHGLVTSVRGPGGGYRIANEIDTITVSDILCAVESATPAPSRATPQTVVDMTQELRRVIETKVRDFTLSVTLKSLVLDQLSKGVQIEKRPMPKRGIFQRPVYLSIPQNVPNSVFELGRTSHAKAFNHH